MTTPGVSQIPHAPRADHPSWTSHRRRLLAAALALTLAASLLALVPGRASAAPTGSVGPGVEITPSGYGPVWLGAFRNVTGGEGLAFCIQARLASSAGSGYAGVDLVADPPLAWAIGAHQGTEEATTRAALGYLVHQRQEVPGSMAGGDVARTKALLAAATPAAVVARAGELIADGEANAGPYTGVSGPTRSETRRTGAVTGVGVISAAGVWQSGKPFTLRLQGPAVFDLTGTAELDGTSADHPLDFAWTATGTGQVTWSVTFGDLGRTTLTRFDAAGNRQDVLTYGNRPASDPTEVTVPGEPFDVVLDFQPEIRTQVATQFVAPDTPLVDQVTVAAAAGDTWTVVDDRHVPLTATGTLYGPFDSAPVQSAQVPADAPVLGTETLTFAGPGTLASPGTLTTTAAGYYTWVWRIDRDAQPPEVQPYLRGDAVDDFGRVAETHVVPFRPRVTTEVADAAVPVGGTFVDLVTAAPAAGDRWLTRTDGEPVTLTAVGTLYGPFDARPTRAAQVPAGAPVAGTETLTFTGPGTQASPGTLTAPGAGYYTWVWRILRDEQPVDSQPYVVGDAVDDFGVEAESPVVPFQPVVSTVRDDREIRPGEPLVDHVTAAATAGDLWLRDPSGGPVTVIATGTAYGPFDSPLPAGSTVPEGAPVAGTEDLTFSGPGTRTTTGTVRAGAAGFYTWVWRIHRDAQPDPWRQLIAGDFTDGFMLDAETATVRHTVEHRSQTREYNVVPGGRAFDTITIGGMPADHGAFTGSGEWAADTPTATVTVHGPLADPPTTATVPDGTPVLWADEIAVTNGVHLIGYDDDHPIVATEPGYYVFVYTFAGDDRVLPFASRADDVLERFYVPAPTEPDLPAWVITQADPQAVVGQPFRDTALVTGSVPPGSTLVFEAYGPFGPGEAPVEADPVWTSSPVPVPGPGAYSSGPTTVDRTGDVYWVATLLDAGGTVVDRGRFGDESEITAIVPAELPVVTTLAAASVDAGRASHDTAYVSGPVPAGATLTFAAYRWTGERAAVDDELVAEVGPVPVSGPGTYGSPEVTLPGPGRYYWVETLHDPEGQVVHTGARGLVDESTEVVAPDRSTAPAVPSVRSDVLAADLPRTGFGAARAAIGGVGLVAAGTGAVLLRRRSRLGG
ncbi:hypothetical protein [Cellulomonas hominis]